MADQNYPRIPAKNWWVVRNRFKQSIPPSVSPNYLATLLGITERGARNVLAPFRTVGIIDEEGDTGDRANRWRVDDEYPKVCEEIRKEIYPEELLSAVPDPKADFEAAVLWFMRETGVGQGTARQMAKFYQLLTEADPSQGQDITSSKVSRSGKPKKRAKTAKRKESEEKPSEDSHVFDAGVPAAGPAASEQPAPAIHIDIQIHISPEASTDQIDQIFASMARHLYPLRTSHE
jgi:hypothetical protein